MQQGHRQVKSGDIATNYKGSNAQLSLHCDLGPMIISIRCAVATKASNLTRFSSFFFFFFCRFVFSVNPAVAINKMETLHVFRRNIPLRGADIDQAYVFYSEGNGVGVIPWAANCSLYLFFLFHFLSFTAQ